MFLSVEEQKKMIGKRVSAIGCCGITDDKEVEGILTQLKPYAIVRIKYYKQHNLPCMVNPRTLKLI
jgi:hypothetical protein